MMNLAEQIREKFAARKIVIVGDLVADQFLHGTIVRVSREAPVFILRHEETATLPGGAANAAVNVASLRGAATLVGIVGEDADGDELLEKLNELHVNCRYIVRRRNFRTTRKVRVLAGQHYAPRQQVIRIDYENAPHLEENWNDEIRENLIAAAVDADAIIISDYNYGVADATLAETAQKIARERQIPLLVDSRFALQNFHGATTATPNQDEVEQILGAGFTENDCVKLCERLGYESLLMTRGNQGMLLIEKNNAPLHIAAVGSEEAVDVTGAGDTVIAAYALALASGLNFAQAAHTANHAGGIVVMKKGTASVDLEELLASLKNARKSNL